MRTTLTIDDDVLRAARQRAASTGESLGQAVSALARAALTGTAAPPTATRDGVRLLPVRPGAPGATLEEVNALRDDLP
jgi:hypothetical protein